ncbi:camphor resistance CrcB protein [Arthrobacter sp. Hiyo4]|nr:camphor resistance CrcB protein [Arthrobacter sp. Hiyo4]
MTNARVPHWRAWLAVAAGSLAGTELRYGLGLAFPETAGAMPWTTLGINVTGSFVLAALTTVWMARRGRRSGCAPAWAGIPGLVHHVLCGGLFN